MAVSPAAFGEVIEVFERNFRDRGELGASVSIWWAGEEVLSLADGWCEREKQRPWTADTLVPVYSATKVPSAATLLMVLERHGMDENTKVREVWPEFPVANAIFGDLLSHQCGLAALDLRTDVFDHDSVVEAIEAQKPEWLPGDGHGYHPRTFGALVEEPVRRLAGKSLGQVWREEIGAPLNLDFWIGLPASEFSRVARLYPGRTGKDELVDAFYKHMTMSGTYTRRAFSSPHGLHAIHEMNEPKAWSSGLPAMGGVGTASGLAKFYQVLEGSVEGPISAKVRHALATARSSADDWVLLRPTVFSCGAQLDPLDSSGRKIRHIYGPSKTAFGHPGAGGCHGMVDLGSGISFAYVMNQMNLTVMPGDKCLEMVEALFGW